ncbi:MAG: nucleotidyltransferase family protein [Anaerolineales bacterium]|nr:nucleotidyltransferase family protein [Anaerolineales bacterium]
MNAVELLVAALHTQAEPAAWFAQAEAASLDWDDLAVTALALGLAPLLHARLEGWGQPLPHAPAQAKLGFARQMEAARHTARTAQLAEALAALPVTPIVLKGAYLAECVYPAPGLRPMNDIDLLFPPESLPAVSAALVALGYGGKEKSADLGPGITKHTSTFKRAEAATATPNPYLSARGGHMLEPHRSLEESWFGLRCDLTPGVWDRSLPVTLAGRPARALAPADALLHLAVHLTFHLIQGSPSFVQLADISVFAQRVAVPWDDLLARARARRASGFVYAGLRLGHEVLGAPIPPDVLVALAAASPAGVRRAADALSLAQAMRRTQQAPLRTFRQRLQRGLADRAETARWAHSPAEAARIWWTLLDVTRTDTFRLATGAKP